MRYLTLAAPLMGKIRFQLGSVGHRKGTSVLLDKTMTSCNEQSLVLPVASRANAGPLRRERMKMPALVLAFLLVPFFAFFVFARTDKKATHVRAQQLTQKETDERTHKAATARGDVLYLEAEVRNAIYLKKFASIPDDKLLMALEYFKQAVDVNKASIVVSLNKHDHETAGYILQHMTDQWDRWAELAQVAKVRAARNDAAAEYSDLVDRYNELVKQHISLRTSYRQAATAAALVPVEYPLPSTLNCSYTTIDLGDGITTTRMSCR